MKQQTQLHLPYFVIITSHILHQWSSDCHARDDYNFAIIHFSQLDNSMPTVWQQYANSMTTVWQQYDNSMTTVWQQYANSMTTVCQQLFLMEFIFHIVLRYVEFEVCIKIVLQRHRFIFHIVLRYVRVWGLY